MTPTQESPTQESPADVDQCPRCGGVVGTETCEDCLWPGFPQSDRLVAAERERDLILAFLDWLNEQKMYVAVCDDETYMRPTWVPASRTHDNLTLDYLGIDAKALERERRDMMRRICH